jgi:hypothetical protein
MSVLAWQVDYPVGEIQRDFIQREVRVLDLLGEHDLAVAVVARESSGSVGTYGELPDLKFLGSDSLVVGLNDRDFVQKPIRPTEIGNPWVLPSALGDRETTNGLGRGIHRTRSVVNGTVPESLLSS